jgi:tRNA(Ile)-lysidine synthase
MVKSMDVIAPIPGELYLACSGGVDSMVAYHFLSRAGRDVKCLYFNHGTLHGDISESFLVGLLGPRVVCGHIDGSAAKGRSREDFWRERRYQFLDQYSDRPVITCHHLDDQIETWIQGFVHGVVGKSISYQRGNYLRPFLRVPKYTIVDYAHRHKIKYIIDPSNRDLGHTRNRIRHNVVPELLKVNPGLYKSMGKLCDPHVTDS